MPNIVAIQSNQRAQSARPHFYIAALFVNPKAPLLHDRHVVFDTHDDRIVEGPFDTPTEARRKADELNGAEYLRQLTALVEPIAKTPLHRRAEIGVMR